MEWENRRQPLLSNVLVNQHVPMATIELNSEEWCFICGPWRGALSGAKFRVSQSVKRWLGGLCEMATSLGVSQLKQWVQLWGYLPDGNDVSTEDEESPSVGSVTRQRLVEIVSDWEHKCVCNSELWNVVTSCVYKWSIDRVTNPNPVYTHSIKSW
jgi:hypothetical protein